MNEPPTVMSHAPTLGDPEVDGAPIRLPRATPGVPTLPATPPRLEPITTQPERAPLRTESARVERLEQDFSTSGPGGYRITVDDEGLLRLRQTR
jgi:hypothetical protein